MHGVTAVANRIAGRLALAVAAGVLLSVSSLASTAQACSIAPPKGAFEQAIDNLLENKRVRQKPNCSFVNGGSYDSVAGEAAFDLGQGRVGQLIQDGRAMLLTVCAEHQVVILYGVKVGEGETSCGPYDVFDETTIDPASGKFDFQAGKDFDGFLRHMDKVGMGYTERLNDWLDMEQPKDSVDLLCGCEVFYPDTVKN